MPAAIIGPIHTDGPAEWQIQGVALSETAIDAESRVLTMIVKCCRLRDLVRRVWTIRIDETTSSSGSRWSDVKIGSELCLERLQIQPKWETSVEVTDVPHLSPRPAISVRASFSQRYPWKCKSIGVSKNISGNSSEIGGIWINNGRWGYRAPTPCLGEQVSFGRKQRSATKVARSGAEESHKNRKQGQNSCHKWSLGALR